MRETLREGAGNSWPRRILAAGPETALAVATLVIQGRFVLVGLPGPSSHPLDHAPFPGLTLSAAFAVIGALAWLLGYRWGIGTTRHAAAWDQFGAAMQAIGWIGSGTVVLYTALLPNTTGYLHFSLAACWILRWCGTQMLMRRIEKITRAADEIKSTTGEMGAVGDR